MNRSCYKTGKIISTVAIIVVCLCLFVGLWYSTGKEKLRFVEKMGSGINLGNALDATELWNYVADADELDYETFWNNPKIDREQLAAVYDAGFRSVRIPVTWEDHLDEEGNISEIWMERVEEVVNMALEENLYVIINLHHESWLDLQPDRLEEICSKFRKVWSQIALRFEKYGDHLLFESMNEPRLRGSEHEWDEGTPELRAMVNHLNREFVDTVRSSGENNSTRYLLITSYASCCKKEALEALEVPKGNLIVSVHLYLPYSFCQDRDGTDLWKADENQGQIEEAFQTINKLFIQKGIPVILTEFGCVDKDNTEERMKWAKFYKTTARKNGVACMWWDDGGDFRLLERENKCWIYPELVNILTEK